MNSKKSVHERIREHQAKFDKQVAMEEKARRWNYEQQKGNRMSSYGDKNPMVHQKTHHVGDRPYPTLREMLAQRRALEDEEDAVIRDAQSNVGALQLPTSDGTASLPPAPPVAPEPPLGEPLLALGANSGGCAECVKAGCGNCGGTTGASGAGCKVHPDRAYQYQRTNLEGSGVNVAENYVADLDNLRKEQQRLDTEKPMDHPILGELPDVERENLVEHYAADLNRKVQMREQLKQIVEGSLPL